MTPNYHRWTDQEQLVLQTFFESLPTPNHRPKHGYVSTLRTQLPGRTDQDIRNGFNVYRRKHLRICNCGHALTKPLVSRCESCIANAKQDRADRLAHGICAMCHNTLDQPGSATTLCPQCRARRNKHKPKDIKRFKAANPTRRPKYDPTTCHRIIPWPACGHSRWMAQMAALSGRPVIDLFGGTGELLRLVSVYGGNPFAYYDQDPRLVNLVQHAIQPDIPLSHDAKVLFGNYRERRRRLKVLGQALKNTQIQCQDALDVLAEPTRHNIPAKTLFLVDPPWPGTHTFQNPTPNHKILIDALRTLPKDQDFILSLGAERSALALIASAAVPLYWRTSGPYSAKSIVALSPRLAASLQNTQNLGIPIDPKRLGFG